MRKVAIPTVRGLLSSHFGGCEVFTIFNIEDNKVIGVEVLPTPEHLTGSYPNFLAAQKITDIIVGGVGRRAIEIFNQEGINVYTGAQVKLPKDIAEDFLADRLSLTGNSCDHEGNGGGPESHGEHQHHQH
ncbi:MAG: ATPase [Bacteroidetes bacterium 4572_77]|nr:MAG: ATPase [Bacteroidetes bacterium 4572_77]